LAVLQSVEHLRAVLERLIETDEVVISITVGGGPCVQKAIDRQEVFVDGSGLGYNRVPLPPANTIPFMNGYPVPRINILFPTSERGGVPCAKLVNVNASRSNLFGQDVNNDI